MSHFRRLFLSGIAFTFAAIAYSAFHENTISRDPASLFELNSELPINKSKTTLDKSAPPIPSVINRIVTNSGSILVDIKNKRAVFISESQLTAERIDYDKVISRKLLRNSSVLSFKDYYNMLYVNQLQRKYQNANPSQYLVDPMIGLERLRESVNFEFLKILESPNESVETLTEDDGISDLSDEAQSPVSH